ncbi:MAG: VCBS repeat-containing protein [Planctomycetes bacterium]|nr:VCBS repeat-containing protein [Planctomycetota bacterium]MCB9920290.1 VCBS repeat-containing protein [Planctomycetota bacterium]
MKIFLATTLSASVLLVSWTAAQTRFAELGRLDHVPAQRQATPIVELVDVDGDNHLDLVTSHRHGLTVMRGSSSGFFVAGTTIELAAANQHGFAAGDVDGDGDVDIVYFAWIGQDTSAKLLLNDGKGGFQPSTVALPSFDRVTSLAFGDVDGDRDLDLFLGRGNGHVSGPGVSNMLLLGDGLGHFVAARSFPADLDNTTAAVFIDVDRDGDLDLIAGNSAVYLGPGPQNTLYLGDGKGGFVFAPNGSLPADSLAEAGIATGDVNGDGYVDFVVSNQAGTSSTLRAAHLFVGNGNGQFSEIPIDVATGLGTDVALADVDKDGDLDLLVSRAGKATGVQLYVGDGKGGFTIGGTGFEDELAQCTSIATGDVDGNGVLDFVAGNDGDRSRLYLGLGGLRWLDATQPIRIGSGTIWITQWTGFELHDLDGDGNLDLLETDAPLRLALGNAKAEYTDVTSTHLPSLTGRLKNVWVADSDRDGDLDLFVHLEDSATWSLRLLVNDGSAKFQLAPASSIPFTKTVLDLSIDDLDADGNVDLVLDSYGGPFLFRGDSKHVFTPDARSTFDTIKGLSPHQVADVDLDGDLDLVYKTANHLPTDEFQVYANDGTGVFQLLGAVKLNHFISSQGFHVCDVDGDRVPDLAISDKEPMLWIGDGKGGFVDETAKRFPLPTHASYSQSHRFADYDLDGDLDVIVAVHTTTTNELRYFRNTGGVFQDTTTTEFGVPVVRAPVTRAIHALDFDGDRDIDLVSFTEQGKSVLSNLYRHTHEPYVLGMGRPFVITVSSHDPAATQIALMQVAGGASNLVIEPFGSLRLDLGTHVLLPPQLMPTSGHLEVTLPTPVNTGLVGLELYTQSLLVTGPFSAWRFTNLAVSNPLIR